MQVGDLQSLDQYRILLIHLMSGRLYKNEDQEFRSNFLFGMVDIQTWIYLKVASFQNVH